MENAIEALKMTFGVLMFVLALTLSISCFSQAREAIDSIVSIKDRETQATYVKSKSEMTEDVNRVVGADTVIPTIYKALKENVKIYFYDDEDNPLYLYTYTDPHEKLVPEPDGKVNIIDTSNLHVADPGIALEVFNGLFRDGEYGFGAISKEKWKIVDKDVNINLYNFLKGKYFEEKLGEYYVDDEGTVIDETSVDINNSNKTKKRVIIYKQVTT